MFIVVEGRVMTEGDKKRASHIVSFGAGQPVFQEGDSGDIMYVIRSGRVRIIRQQGNQQLTLAVLHPGESFGEMALIDRASRSATAIAEIDTELVVVGERAFEQMIKDRPDIALRLLRKLSARLREANRQIELITVHGSAVRVVEVLRMWAPPDSDQPVTLPGVTPEKLWRASGTTRESFGEILHRLGEADLAHFTVQGLEIKAPARLAEYLEYLDLKRSFDPATQQELAALQAQTAGSPEGSADLGAVEAEKRRSLSRFHELRARFEKS